MRCDSKSGYGTIHPLRKSAQELICAVLVHRRGVALKLHRTITWLQVRPWDMVSRRHDYTLFSADIIWCWRRGRGAGPSCAAPSSGCRCDVESLPFTCDAITGHDDAITGHDCIDALGAGGFDAALPTSRSFYEGVHETLARWLTGSNRSALRCGVPLVARPRSTETVDCRPSAQRVLRALQTLSSLPPEACMYSLLTVQARKPCSLKMQEQSPTRASKYASMFFMTGADPAEANQVAALRYLREFVHLRR